MDLFETLYTEVRKQRAYSARLLALKEGGEPAMDVNDAPYSEEQLEALMLRKGGKTDEEIQRALAMMVIPLRKNVKKKNGIHDIEQTKELIFSYYAMLVTAHVNYLSRHAKTFALEVLHKPVPPVHAKPKVVSAGRKSKPGKWAHLFHKPPQEQ